MRISTPAYGHREFQIVFRTMRTAGRFTIIPIQGVMLLLMCPPVGAMLSPVLLGGALRDSLIALKSWYTQEVRCGCPFIFQFDASRETDLSWLERSTEASWSGDDFDRLL